MTAVDNSVLPKGLIPSYKKISEAVVYALNSLGIKAELQNSAGRISNSSLCFSYPAGYEIVVDGKKIVGSAQKRGRKALLQQGSIFVRPNSAEVLTVLKNPPEKLNAISVEEILGRQVSFAKLKQALIAGFKKIMKIGIGAM